MLSKNPSNHRYFVEFAYKGKNYHGWQIQPNALSVQESLNKSLSTIICRDINLVGAGRTDTGVHASHFVAHFEVQESIQEPVDLVYKLNRFVDSDIRIDRILEVDTDLHARFSAMSRTYHYIISKERAPFLSDSSWFISRELDFGRMCEANEILKDYTDFTSFAKLHADTKTNICDIKESGWEIKGNYLVFRIKADRFLRNMVRAIVGTLVEVGLGKISLEDFRRIIEAKDRSAAGQSAPPQGLFLSHIEYPEEQFMAMPKSPIPGFLDIGN